VELYQASAAQGYGKAQFNLAMCYKYGEGVKQSAERAMELFQASATQGNATAQKMLHDLTQ
jgi:TPR repeat protein